MADLNHVIEPERQGLWIAATFVIALLALVIAFLGMKRNSDLMYVTQGEVLLLNKKIDALKAAGTPLAPPVQPAAPEEPKK